MTLYLHHLGSAGCIEALSGRSIIFPCSQSIVSAAFVVLRQSFFVLSKAAINVGLVSLLNICCEAHNWESPRRVQEAWEWGEQPDNFSVCENMTATLTTNVEETKDPLHSLLIHTSHKYRHMKNTTNNNNSSG